MSWSIKVQPLAEQHTAHEDDITYNLGKMLRQAGFDPNLHDGVTVKVLRPIAQGAWQSLYENEKHYKQFEPENGWGTYTDALLFMARLSDYTRNAPDDYVMRVS
ncbi:MAG: hypothetical protein DRH08_00595 [Deltaproteobacteria bacterium]|nr:MAG: hypothetical protein DRH08_00595 [Deltaproteobacteria bacterium]